MTPTAGMQDHFTKVSAVYRDVRTTDREPIRHIADALDGASSVRAADIGCGDGRYGLPLFDALPGLHLTCVDANEAMLAEVGRLLADHGIDRFATRHSPIESLELDPGTFDCVVSFNAIHHFDLGVFFDRARDGLKDGGHLFVYTRLPSQNMRSIWGRYFPGFAEKEQRLVDLGTLHRSIEATESLVFDAANCFRYPRRAGLDRLIEQARNRHYSTFSLYGDDEFDRALATFEARIRRHYDDLDDIVWRDQNILVHARRHDDA